jgi:hypothetical protein
MSNAESGIRAEWRVRSAKVVRNRHCGGFERGVAKVDVTRGLAVLGLLVTLGAASPPVQAQDAASSPILLVVAIDASLTDMRDGVRLGIDEMQRTASLLGRELKATWLSNQPPTATSPLTADEPASALLVGTAGQLDAAAVTGGRVPVLALSPVNAAGTAARSPWLFQVRAERPGSEWRPDLNRFGAGELNERYQRRTGRGMTADAWAGWIAVKAVVEAALRSDAAIPADLASALRELEFDGHKGVPLTFDDRQRLVQPTYD